MMKLSEILAPQSIVMELSAKTREGVVGELTDALLAGGSAAPALRGEIIAGVMAREKRSSTGFGRGVAVPHTKHDKAASVGVALGLSTTGVDFASMDGQPAYIVMLLLSPTEQREEHLKAMEVIFKYLGKEAFRKGLRACTSADEVMTYIRDADNLQLAP